MRTIHAPHKYVQGEHVLNDIGSYLKDLMSHVLIVTGNSAYKAKGQVIEESLKANGVAYKFFVFSGDCTDKNIQIILDQIKEQDYDGVMAMGGGKVVDAVKAAAHLSNNLPLVIAPSIASSNAPCSSFSVVYNEEGNFVGPITSRNNPYMVMVDTTLMHQAPPEYFVSGMGDALASYIEASVCKKYGLANMIGCQQTVTAMTMGKLVYDTLLDYGYLALKELQTKQYTEILDQVIETNILTSALCFEGGGLSCAHTIEDALMTIPECHYAFHGFRVAFGSLCLMVMEEYPLQEIHRVMHFCHQVGLPITLRELGLTENVETKVRQAMPVAYVPDDEAYRMPPYASEEVIYEAILKTNAIGEAFLA